MSTKLYANKNWLIQQYMVQKLTPQQIAIQCKVSERTIYNWLVQHGIIEKERSWKR